MKAEELMIGNYISDIHASESSYWQVKQLLGKVCYYGDYYSEEYENLKPIPLTEEWLVRFGAEKRSLHYYKLNGIIICVQDFFFECYLGGINVHIKYVHQLQNLYYTLTNKHLTIK
jgi:hypothetical protein